MEVRNSGLSNSALVNGLRAGGGYLEDREIVKERSCVTEVEKHATQDGSQMMSGGEQNENTRSKERRREDLDLRRKEQVQRAGAVSRTLRTEKGEEREARTGVKQTYIGGGGWGWRKTRRDWGG